jgi:hypothetical protein
MIPGLAAHKPSAARREPHATFVWRMGMRGSGEPSSRQLGHRGGRLGCVVVLGEAGDQPSSIDLGGQASGKISHVAAPSFSK